MPKHVVEKKSSAFLTSAIISTVLSLIPIGIVALVSIKHSGVWSAPYPRFLLYFLILHTIFAFGVGYVGQMRKIIYVIFL